MKKTMTEILENTMGVNIIKLYLNLSIAAVDSFKNIIKKIKICQYTSHNIAYFWISNAK